MKPIEKEQLFELIGIFRQKRRQIIKVTAIVFFLSIAFELLLKNQYESTVIILPETDKSKLLGLSGLSDLASLAGIGGGEVSIEKLYLAIFESESALKSVIYARYKTQQFGDGVNLIQYYEIRGDSEIVKYERMLKRLRNMLNISQDRQTNIVTITVETEEPSLSSDILNNLTNATDDFLRTKSRSNATEQRKWIELRLKEVEKDLKHSEDSLKSFRSNNRVVSQSPELMVEEGRLTRNVEVSNSLYLELKSRYEVAKIDEIKNIPLLNILDNARLAGIKSSPHRTLAVLFLTILAFALSTLSVYITYKYPDRVNDYRDIGIKLLDLVRLK
jgi:uncharacterized protein involved in exopolysaccharide biosynthesis